jgi:hypothetical protein
VLFFSIFAGFLKIFYTLYINIMSMKKFFTLMLFLALALPFGAFAQHSHGVCGTTGEWAQAVTERLLHNRAQHRDGFVTNRSIVYVPVKFHLTANNDGSGRINDGRVYDQLCALNEDFLGSDIQFYLKDGTFNYINNTTVFQNHSSGAGQLFMSSADDNEALNIFITQDANTNSGGVGVTLGYYTSARDWIVVRKDEVGTTRHTLPHEVGHFFSLPHPFNGWDNELYDEAIHGNPVSSTISPGFIPVEFANGSNCASAGDYFCDTNANYGFGFGWDDCDYDAGTMDPNGQVVDPQESLFMGYFFGCPRDEFFFTDEQTAAMQMDLASAARDYVNPGTTPNLSPITETPSLIAPDLGEMVSGYNAVLLEWESVSGADFYMLEIDKQIQFNSPELQRLTVYGNTKVMELEPNTTYFWRVRPLNAYFTCTNVSQFRGFTTDGLTTTSDLDFVSQWIVSPNPVNPSGELNVNLESTKGFEANIQLLSVTGQVVQKFGQFDLTAGNNNFVLSLHDMPKGLYLLNILSDEGTTTQRIVIQ